MTDDKKTDALEALILSVNPLTTDPTKFLDQIEDIIEEKK
jgi:hypothetical protein